MTSASACELPVLVFTRTPIPGKVKTRLVPALGARGAARLHLEMLRRTLATAVEACDGRVSLWCSPSTEHPSLSAIADSFGVELHAQRGEDLGARMHHAFATACRDGPGALLVGSDCPMLEADDLREAARMLREHADAVLGPARDGGYYLIGVRRSDARVFSDIEWGTDTVLDATRARLGALGWRWRELEVRADVDRPEDLELLEGFPDVCGGAKAPIF